LKGPRRVRLAADHPSAGDRRRGRDQCSGAQEKEGGEQGEGDGDADNLIEPASALPAPELTLDVHQRLTQPAG